LVVFTLVVTHITIVAVTVYLHRYSAHRSLELHPILQHFFRFWLWLTTGMVTKEWTAIHRKHHAVCETEDDPHSPVIKGIGEIFWRGVEAYKEAAADESIMQRYGAGCPDDWLERNVYGYNSVGIVVMLVIDVALFGAIGITIWAVQMLWIPVFAAGVINGIGHWWGYRNFECPDAARNIVPWGILIGGEELHNNHHTYPNSAKLSVKWFEFDLGYAWIRLFEMLKLAKVRSTGPVVERVEGKAILDADAAWALLNDRFRVMSRYAEEVVAPVVEAEYHKADLATRKLLKRTKKVLCKEESLVDEKARDRITALVEQNDDIRLIYDLRMRLQDVWAKRGGNMDDVLNALKDWCQEAEASGMQTLREFSETLKSYATPKVAHA
jgi:fatty-acid desaturase